jgi:murein L,D-transpeptidase YcbB/YkuD
MVVACARAGAGVPEAPLALDQRPAADTAPAPSPEPRSPPPDHGLHLDLNIPALRLDVYQGPDVIRRYRVAVGDLEHQTPVGAYSIQRVEWNPTWIPPSSEWAKSDTAMGPGPSNPMGRVKLAFQDLYFLHGTPDPGSVGRPASHGCVRLANRDAVELAELVHGHGSPDLGSGDLAALAAGWGPTRNIPLVRGIPLMVRYATVEVIGAEIVAHRDVYARGPDVGDALAALRAAGVDAARVDTAAVRALQRRAGITPASAPLRSVLIGEAIGVR